MHLRFRCPVCSQPQARELSVEDRTVNCRHCAWTREVRQPLPEDASPDSCLLCGCSDLWRQKAFPQRLGLVVVVVGAVLSTIAWSQYLPEVAIGILMLIALIDLALFSVMKDMLVCYRCGSQHRRTVITSEHPRFDLEMNERYRQEAIRLENVPEHEQA